MYAPLPWARTPEMVQGKGLTAGILMKVGEGS